MKMLAITASVCALLVGCATAVPSLSPTTAMGPSVLPATSSSAASSAPDEIALPTAASLALASGVTEVCAGVAIAAILRGDPDDRHVVWLLTEGGTRVNVTWPPGYHARFTPGLEVLDGAGAIVLRGGEPVTGACVTGDPDQLQLIPPFN